MFSIFEVVLHGAAFSFRSLENANIFWQGSKKRCMELHSPKPAQALTSKKCCAECTVCLWSLKPSGRFRVSSSCVPQTPEGLRRSKIKNQRRVLTSLETCGILGDIFTLLTKESLRTAKPNAKDCGHSRLRRPGISEA